MTTDVATVGTQDTVAEARALMRERDIHHLPVVHAGELVGLVVDRDLEIPLDWPEIQRWLDGLPIEDLMTRRPVTVTRHASVGRAATVLRAARVTCLPVVEAGALVGIITQSDLLALVSQLDRLALLPNSPPGRRVARA